jgi:hypothetical protein
MPTISDATIRALYELYGNDDYPVDEYCIGCPNCEYYTFPCLNCAMYVFNGNLGEGNDGGPELMDIDDDGSELMDIDDDGSELMDIDDDVVNDNDIIDLTMEIDDRIPSESDSESEEYIPRSPTSPLQDIEMSN